MEAKFTDDFLEDLERIGLSQPKGGSLKKIYWRMVPYQWRPSQILYRLKCFFWKRYSTVRPRSLPRDNWIDRDQLLLHCCFEILCRFLEDECSPGHVDWSHPDQNRHAMDRMRQLEYWWKHEYPKMEGEIGYYHNYNEIQKKLHQLISLRKFMWT